MVRGNFAGSGEMKNYLHIGQIEEYMRGQGLPRGFQQETLRKKKREGKFVAPFIKIGNTPYYSIKGLEAWLEENTVIG